VQEIKKIKVEGYKGEVVSNLFFNSNSESLAILFPGIGYNNDMPLLYYPTELMSQKNIDILRVDYRYNDNEKFRNTTYEEKKEWIRADAIASVENILKKKEFKKIIIVCKSIGTIAGIEILSAIDRLQHAEIIWLTPLCQNEEIVNSLYTITNRSLIVIGTGDQCFVKQNVDKLQEKENYDVMEIPDADHSLEIKGDTIKSVQLMKDILKRMQEFIDTSR
jgi:predicted alpha/beta-hydrolase family hydrolase